MERIIFPDIDALEKEVKQLRKQLKQMNVTLYKTDTLKLLKERKNEYNDMVNDYNNSFDQLVKEWRIKLDNGIYFGYRDDEHLNEIIRPLTWKIERMNYRDSLLRKVKEIKRKVNEIKRDIESECNYIKVAI